jgi:hypothetical protein
MTETTPAPLTRRGYTLPILIGIAALSVAACGSSQTSSNSAPQPQASGTTSAAPTTAGSSPAPKGGGKDHLAGLITSVTGNTLVVSQNNSTTTVDFSSATKVSEVTPATLTDVTAGSCVMVRPARDSDSAPGTPITAASVLISASKDGQCFAGGQQAGSPTATPPGGPAGHRGLRGTVTSAGGTTLVLTTAGANSPTTVDLSGNTTYAKRAPASDQSIAQGKCVTARGSMDASGTLQADMIALRPAVNGSCPSMKH